MDVFRIETPRGYHLTRTFSTYRMGPGDPTLRIERNRFLAALLTPHGAVTVGACQGADHLDISAVGPGAEWVRPRLPAFFGLLDDPTRFIPVDPIMRNVWKGSLGTHLPTLPAVFHRLTQVILLQLVTTTEANRAWRSIVRAFGTAAPGEANLMTPPAAQDVSRIPWYRFVADGVPHRQARTLVRVARLAPEIEAQAELGPAPFSTYLESIAGIGPWTVGYMAGTALGDPDAVLLGDDHLPHAATWLLRNQPRGTDADLLELLEPYRGNRFRVIRAVWASGIRPPRRGPKRAPRPLYRER